MSAPALGTVLNSDAMAQTRTALFNELDNRAREIEQQWKETWVEMADLCATMRDNELWREGGYDSFGSWLQSACPTSRSYAYMAMGIREELKEIPESELRQIPLGNASILKDTPKQHRNGKVLEAAKQQPPREFIGTVIHEAPDSHLEQKQCHKFRLDTSHSKVLCDAFSMWRVLNDDPEAPREAALEGIVADWMEEHQRQYDWKLQGK